MRVVIKKSDKPKKKMMATFYDGEKKKRTIHFGQFGADDYTKTKDKAQRRRYIERHRRNENWNDPMTAGTLAKYILWGSSTSLRTNINNYKKRFNLK